MHARARGRGGRPEAGPEGNIGSTGGPGGSDGTTRRPGDKKALAACNGKLGSAGQELSPEKRRSSRKARWPSPQCMREEGIDMGDPEFLGPGKFHLRHRRASTRNRPPSKPRRKPATTSCPNCPASPSVASVGDVRRRGAAGAAAAAGAGRGGGGRGRRCWPAARGGGSAAPARRAAKRRAGATGTVERRTLAERLTATGTIGYAGETTVLARLSGTVTALPAIGDVIRRGERLYALAGEPVLLMYGAVPAYRTLAEGVGDGEDVEQLERNLAALGYEPGTVDEEFTYATAAAVADWQEDLGLEASGEVELGRVAFLRGPQRVTELEATLGEALGGGGRREGSEGESEPPRSPSCAPARPGASSASSSKPTSSRSPTAGRRSRWSFPAAPKCPARCAGWPRSKHRAAKADPGEEVEPGVEATISVTGKHRIPALDGATVSVRFTQQVRKHVLSVPLTALVAIGGERFAVYVRGGGARQRIVVTPGLAADGYVEVEGKGLRAGMTVETGE